MEYSDKENNNKARSYKVDRHNYNHVSFKDERSAHADFQKNKELNQIVRNGLVNSTLQQSVSTIQRLKKGDAIVGHFTTIPSETLGADWDDTKNVLYKSFEMKALFTTPRTHDDGKGEYRQYIKGYFARNGVHEQHTLIPPVDLEEDTWHEDGDENGGYGHHGIAMEPGNMFIENPKGSESYRGKDNPESNPIEEGYESTEMHLDFCGKLVSTDSQGNDVDVLDQSFWSVYGTKELMME